MFDEATPGGAKLPLDDREIAAVQRLGRWMRVVGTIQLAIAGIFLFFFLLISACGFAGGGDPLAMLIMAIALAIPSVALLQGLRIQAAGEQFKNLAEERDIDYLEIAFMRLKTVFVIDVVIGVLLALLQIGSAL